MVCVVVVWFCERESCSEGDGFQSFRIGFVREKLFCERKAVL